jgi:hypothetical protein
MSTFVGECGEASTTTQGLAYIYFMLAFTLRKGFLVAPVYQPELPRWSASEDGFRVVAV